MWIMFISVWFMGLVWLGLLDGLDGRRKGLGFIAGIKRTPKVRRGRIFYAVVPLAYALSAVLIVHALGG